MRARERLREREREKKDRLREREREKKDKLKRRSYDINNNYTVLID